MVDMQNQGGSSLARAHFFLKNLEDLRVVPGFIKEKIGSQFRSVLVEFARSVIGKKYDDDVFGLREGTNGFDNVKAIALLQL